MTPDHPTPVEKVKRPVPRLALTQQEAALALGMSVTHFQEHVKEHLPVRLCGALRLYPVSGLEEWLCRDLTLDGRSMKRRAA